MTRRRTRFHVDPLIDAAIEAAIGTHPYYASALTSRLRIVPDANVPTMATSAQWVTHYNPKTLRTWTAAEAGAVLVHELEHLLRRHAERCNGRNHERWNVAADAEINQRLDGLPAGVIYPETLGMPRGSVAEVYYAATKGNDNSEPEHGQPGDGSGTGQPGQPGTGQPQPGECGSSAGGPVQPHEQGDAYNPGAGAANDGADAIRETAEQVMAGYFPGTGEGTEIRDWAEAEIGIDRSAWYRALATTVGHTLASTGAPTAYRWPGRRDMRDMGGAMVPRWVSERPACAVVIDTSGSVTQSDIEMAKAAGHFIGRMADAIYWTCDTTPTRLGPNLPERVRAGGGTDLRNGIAAAIADGARCVVVITDCGTPWPDEDPGVPVIIGANYGARSILAAGPGSTPWYPPEWMTVLPILPMDE